MRRERGAPSRLVGESGEMSGAKFAPGAGFLSAIADALHRRLLLLRTARPEPAYDPLPQGESVREESPYDSKVLSQPYCVFATCGGIACVTKDVASSMAVPSEVGITMRNGTRMRVPAIGTSVISILRAVARYLITGRSGI
jgi:hypothetical protein